MKTLIIELEDDVYRHFELKAAIDDLRPKEAAEKLITEITEASIEKRKINFNY